MHEVSICFEYRNKIKVNMPQILLKLYNMHRLIIFHLFNSPFKNFFELSLCLVPQLNSHSFRLNSCLK